MIRALLVDDEAPARSELRYLLAAHPEVEVVGEAGGAPRRSSSRASSPDVVFLDVEMPGLTGVEAAPLVRERTDPPAVVFVTAHERYALDAFAVEAFDYLLKPVDPERLARVVERLRERSVENVLPVEKVPVVSGGGTELLDYDQVHYVQADGDYSRVHTYDRSYLCTASLGELEERLPAGALRAHPPLVPRQPEQGRGCAARRPTGSACSSPTPSRRSSTSRAASRASCASVSAWLSEPVPWSSTGKGDLGGALGGRAPAKAAAAARGRPSVEPTIRSARWPSSDGPSAEATATRTAASSPSSAAKPSRSVVSSPA